MKILKVKEREVDRGWNGSISLSVKVKNTLIKKGYRSVQIGGNIYSVSILNTGLSSMRIAWLGDKLGEIDPLGYFVGEFKS